MDVVDKLVHNDHVVEHDDLGCGNRIITKIQATFTLVFSIHGSTWFTPRPTFSPGICPQSLAEEVLLESSLLRQALKLIRKMLAGDTLALGV